MVEKRPNAPVSAAALFLISFASLFVEIMLIRWIGTEVRVFAFVQNLALLACFLGFGLGCYHADAPRRIAISILALAGLVVLVSVPGERWQTFLYDLSNFLGFSRDNVLWMAQRDHGLSPFMLTIVSVAVLSVLLLLLVLAMVPLGQWVGHYLDVAGEPVRAYSINLAGSLAGILFFAVMSFAGLSPVWWFATAIVALLVFEAPRPSRLAAMLLALIVVVAMLYSRDDRSKTYWSPYQKVVVTPMGGGEHYVEVNNSVYMAINDLRASRFAGTRDEARYHASPYNSPLRFAPRLDRVLIVGSGGGNDVAGALRAGARQIDAVEIDPVILDIGRRLHPEGAYGSPRVRAIVNDARAFFRQSRDRYDAIVFGLLDSHTHFSGYSNMRIDNYVYTEESFREARRLLAPGGVLIMKFEVRAPWTWMGDRFHATLTRVFGRPPLTYHAPTVARATSATVFINSNEPLVLAPELQALIARNPPRFRPGGELSSVPVVDDWPYVYQRIREIPRTYVTVSIDLLALALLLVGRSFEPRRWSSWRFFFLGAGFLLMEAQMVSRLALYFGTTWVVNCVVISVVLLVLVAANLYVMRKPPRTLRPYFAALVIALGAIYFTPWNASPWDVRVTGSLLAAAYCVPVFLAGVIFTESFRRQTRRSHVLGANIVGSVAGGLAQNASLILGMKALLLLAASFYVLAAVAKTRDFSSS